MTVVAIEGLCFAGKSTLAGTLSLRLATESIVILPDYSDLTILAERPALPATTASAELAAFEYYLSIDNLRWTGVREQSPGLVIQDRSVHSLLAHVYSNDSRTGFGVFRQAVEHKVSMPIDRRVDMVIYLDVREETLLARYSAIPNELPALLTTLTYMRGFRAYFSDPRIAVPSLAVIDANRSPGDVADDTVRILERAGLC